MPPPWRYVTVSPRSGPAGPGSLDAGAMTSLVMTSAPRFTRWALGGPTAGTVRSRFYDEGGDAQQLCGPDSGRGRDRDLLSELFWHSVRLPWANQQAAAGSGEACLVT